MKFKRKGKEHCAIKEICLTDGTIIGVFEGSRGANPDCDILINQPKNPLPLGSGRGFFS